MKTLLTRQPLFDAEDHVAGFELLCRGSGGSAADETVGTAAARGGGVARGGGGVVPRTGGGGLPQCWVLTQNAPHGPGIWLVPCIS